MVEKKVWLSMRHFVTNEYLQDIYMGQKPYKICNTDLKTNGLIESINNCTILASNLIRSKQTVEYLCSTFPLIEFDVIYSNLLIERGLGDFEGQSKSVIKKNKEYFENDKFKVKLTPPNGESFESFKVRVENALKQIYQINTFSNVLVVSHLQVLRMIRCLVLGKFNYNFWYGINYNHGEIVQELLR